MSEPMESYTVTLHWLAGSREQASTIVCEDSVPERLVPLLLAGCGLGAADEDGRQRLYTLRLGTADGKPLRGDRPVGAQAPKATTPTTTTHSSREMEFLKPWKSM